MDIFLKSLYLPLVNCHMLKSTHLQEKLLYLYASISIIILIIHVIKDISQRILNFIVIAHFSLLVFLSVTMENGHENYWLLFFLVLYFTNHFTLPNVSEKFCIPQRDLLSLSLVFLNTFLINAFS